LQICHVLSKNGQKNSGSIKKNKPIGKNLQIYKIIELFADTVNLFIKISIMQ